MYNINDLEVLRKCNYHEIEGIGLVSDNAYMSIVMTNRCQFRCFYCINGDTDRTLELPIEKAVKNIKEAVEKYGIKEAVILGGEPTLHPRLIEFTELIRKNVNLRRFGMTTNGTEFLHDRELFKVAKNLDFINISYHNEEFIGPVAKLNWIASEIHNVNPSCKVRVNTNIWRGNHDTVKSIHDFIEYISLFGYIDEFRVSNLIYKDDFSVNTINSEKNKELILSNDEYEKIFQGMIDEYSTEYTLIENKEALGFVRYILIPDEKPIIINWNIDSHVSEQVCENNLKERKIHTFKCLVSGNISLSWNEGNRII